MYALRSWFQVEWLSALVAITVASVSSGLPGAQLDAPAVSAGEYVVTWNIEKSPEDTLYLLEYRGSSLIERHAVTGTKSMAFCRSTGHYRYRVGF
jgi:hypothetical protein